MPITIDNTSHLNSDYGRYQGDTSYVKDGGGSTAAYTGRGSDLPAGSTVTGEIVEKDGNQVTIRLGNDQTISARIQGSADIEVGMKMTFEVARGADNRTALRPLFSNLANNSAAMSAIKAAGLPVNETTLAMTDRMMSESMPVNRSALSEMFRNVSAHSNVSPESIVQMTKLNMPLTESNVIQFDNYRNFEHQITNDLQNVSDGVADLFREAVDGATGVPGNESQVFGNLTANEVINEVLNLIDTDSLDTIIPEERTAVTGQNTAPEAAQVLPQGGEVTPEAESSSSALKGTVDSFISDIREIFTARTDNASDFPVNPNLSLSSSEQQMVTDTLTDIMTLTGREETVTGPLDPAQVMTMVRELVEEYPPGTVKGEITDIPGESIPGEGYENAEAAGEKEAAAAGTAGEKEAAVIDGTAGGKEAASAGAAGEKETATASGATGEKEIAAAGEKASETAQAIKAKVSEKLDDLLKSDGFTKLLKDSVKAQMSIKPADVSQNGKIEELYERIQRTSHRITQLMESIGRMDSPAAQSSAALNDNVNFMNQLNEFVNYVQLPLKMAGEDANGELYVYTNKKNLADKDGNYSALLHLDMEHLGPMDVYVTMRDHIKVNTSFYLQSEELLDFMEAHIDQLTKRLTEKGYDTSTRITKREKGEPITPMADEFTKDDAKFGTHVMVSKMRFDVRA